ncbi:DUF3450 domain-containing protein [Motilimonas cestriensis]|uniref:DUF3450 domain-containing protein n=1 Tax=Motilimonas cestriensis TaxID=2742685 RepID=UPI003DA61B92
MILIIIRELLSSILLVEVVLFPNRFLSVLLVVSSASLFSTAALAASVTQVQQQALNDQQQARQSQHTIDQLDDNKLAIIQKVKQLQAEAEQLEQYNVYLTELVQDQASEVASYQQQIIDVKETRQGLVPLMVKMLDNLAQFVALDAPFLLDERQQRISQLQQMMNKADISEAEKYRRILTAYQIEAEYGSKMGEYQGELALDGTTRTVQYFYLGRVAFVALSLDGKAVWSWDRNQQQWLSVDNAYAQDVKQAIAIAKKTEIPNLIKLPLIAEVSQ